MVLKQIPVKQLILFPCNRWISSWFGSWPLSGNSNRDLDKYYFWINWNFAVDYSHYKQCYKSVEYCEIDKQNKPQEFKAISPTKFKIKQTACEIWNLIRLAPLMLGEYVEIDNEFWNLLVLFCQLTECLCALEFSNSDLIYLDESLHSFFSKYTSKFPHVIIKPKAHFIQHYAQMISRFGSLVKTLRFESKHSFFKSVSNKNRKNIFQSMAEKHQFWMYLHYSTMLDNETISQDIGVTEVPIESFNDI